MLKISGIDTIFWDLDGTLVDPRQRLYQLFIELTGSVLSYEEYWKLKRQGLSQQKMLEYISFAEFSAQEFKDKWLKNVERPDLLGKDVLFDEVVDVLTFTKGHGIKMYIVTNRQSYDRLIKQLDDFNILSDMDGIISTFQKCSKAESVRNVGLNVSKAVLLGTVWKTCVQLLI